MQVRGTDGTYERCAGTRAALTTTCHAPLVAKVSSGPGPEVLASAIGARLLRTFCRGSELLPVSASPSIGARLPLAGVPACFADQ